MLILRANSISSGLVSLFAPILLLIVQSCAKSPIGQKLSNSFDSSIEPLAEEKISKSLETRKSSVIPKSSVKKTNKSVIPFPQPQKDQKLDLNVIPFVPQPYRITIKLSGANPSAPAETVTRALRKAGVQFEVEMIERVETQSQNKRQPSASPRSRR